MRALAPFLRRLARHRARLALGFLCVPLAQLADIAISVVLRDALDRLDGVRDPAFLGTVFLLVAGIALGHGVLRFLQRWWVVSGSRFFERDLKQELFEHLVRLDLDFHARSRSGDLVSRLTSDVENVRMFLGPGAMYVLGALVTVPVAAGLMLEANRTMTLALVLPLVLMGAVIRWLSPRLHRLSLEVQERLADVGHLAQESFAGVRVVRGYAREQREVERFQAASRAYRDGQIDLARIRGIQSGAIHGANLLTFAAILVVGGRAMVAGTLTRGELFLFVDLTFKLFWPIIALGWMAGVYPRAVASARRLTELLEREPAVRDPEQPVERPRIEGALSLSNVSFRYPGSGRDALQGVSLELAPGRTLGVVGPTGAGKSTLLDLLGRFHDAEGEIALDGVPLRRWRIASLRGALGYVPQDGFLFSDTWRANVSFGLDEELDDERLAALARAAALDEDVAAFEHGFDQRIGERGVTLSGGQRQRTALARALAIEPPILVLDDALSAVDTRTERRLIETLRAAGEGRTVVIAAQRLSAVAHADLVLVLGRDGRPAALGTHAELLARPGWYRDTWRRQQAAEELEEL